MSELDFVAAFYVYVAFIFSHNFMYTMYIGVWNLE